MCEGCVLGASLISDVASSTSGSADCGRQTGGALQRISQHVPASITCHKAVCGRLRSFVISWAVTRQCLAAACTDCQQLTRQLQLAFSRLRCSPYDQQPAETDIDSSFKRM